MTTAAETVVMRVSPEEWRPWPTNAMYEVSSHGRVRSYVPWRGKPVPRVLRPGKLRSGHLSVILLVDGARRTKTVHQLVLEAFIGPRPDGLMCRHLNDCPGDNRVENLAWGTRSENERDRKRNDPGYLAGERNVSSRLTESDVREIRAAPRHVTSAHLASEYGVSSSAIRKVRQGRNWRHVE